MLRGNFIATQDHIQGIHYNNDYQAVHNDDLRLWFCLFLLVIWRSDASEKHLPEPVFSKTTHCNLGLVI
jgi:hypothetical protein